MRALATQSLRRLLLSHEIAFLLLVIVTGAIGGLWAYFWQQTSAESVRLNRLAHTAEEIRTVLFRQIKEVALARLRDDPGAQQVYSAFSKDIGQNFNTLRRLSNSRAEDYAIQDVQQAYRKLQSDMNKIFEDSYLLNQIVRIQVLDPSYEQALVGEFEKAFHNFQGLINQHLAQQEAKIETWTKFAPFIIPIPILVAGVLLLMSRVSLNRGFVRPMRRIMEGTRDISGGDLSRRLGEEGAAEIVALARGINHMASELAASRDALVDSERQAALGALVPVVAHNIRNPLAAIRASAQLLPHADSPAEVHETALAIIDSVDRLGRWVSALVSYLHPLKPYLTTRNATDLLDSILALIHPRLLEKAIVVERQPWVKDLMFEVDSDLMEQALYGLLNNAVEASPQGGRIRLGVEALGDRLRLSIEDHGGGIPFTPEPSDLTPGPTTKRFGTGLGIPVAFKVCKAHGWTLNFEVIPRSGTLVTIIAPRGESPMDNA